jgi:hypothetical protein
MRGACISDVHYDVFLNMPKGDWFSGRVQVNFKLLKVPEQELWLDFWGAKVANMTVNKQEGPIHFTKHKVHIPHKLLKVGETNTVEMFFLNNYRKDGCGLHSYVDSID